MQWRILMTVILLVPWGSGAGAAEPPSRGRLVADVESIQPGTAFHLGVIITLQDRWHTYWLNPGDAGMPPKFQWQLPEGFTAGPVLWPAPTLIADPGEYDFGFLHELQLFWPIQPPPALTAGQECTFRVDATWLVCKDTCIPQTGQWQVTLPVRATPPVAVAAVRQGLEQTRAAAPQAAPDWSFRVAAEPDFITLTAVPPAALSLAEVMQSRFFPLEPNLVTNNPTPWTRTEHDCRLRLPRVSGVTQLPARFQGVLVLPENPRKEVRAITVDAAWPAATVKE